MKTIFAMLSLALSLAGMPFNQTNALPKTRPSTAADELKLKNDGTATVTGVVLENNLGCSVDAACYLQLRVGSRVVRIIYHPGEGEVHVNGTASRQGSAIKKGAHVRAYGKYSRKKDLDVIETFSSDNFYIRVLK